MLEAVPTLVMDQVSWSHSSAAGFLSSVTLTVLLLLLLTPPPARRLRIVEKVELIGGGSCGRVYRGIDRQSNQFCAIKELIISNDRRSMEDLNQLNQEVFLLEQFSHPNIVQYYGSILIDGVFSVYMEYASNGSIDKLLKNYGPFEECLIRHVTKEILSVLAYLHGNNIIHRDIKGANILVTASDEVKLADFGLAKQISSLAEVHSSDKGTVYWMAPEVILSNHSRDGYNLSADIWSLGCSVIEMATGKPPLRHLEPVAAIFKIANDNEYIPEIPDVLSNDGKEFLKLCLKRTPASRPSAAQLMDEPFIRNQGGELPLFPYMTMDKPTNLDQLSETNCSTATFVASTT